MEENLKKKLFEQKFKETPRSNLNKLLDTNENEIDAMTKPRKGKTAHFSDDL